MFETIFSTTHSLQLAFLGVGGIGNQELLVVGIIALLLFGKRLPEVARNLGRGFSEFKRGVSGFQDEVRQADREASRMATSRPAITSSSSGEPVGRQPVPAADERKDEFTAPRFDLD